MRLVIHVAYRLYINPRIPFKATKLKCKMLDVITLLVITLLVIILLVIILLVIVLFCTQYCEHSLLKYNRQSLVVHVFSFQFFPILQTLERIGKFRSVVP